jgi:hypothetical protein
MLRNYLFVQQAKSPNQFRACNGKKVYILMDKIHFRRDETSWMSCEIGIDAGEGTTTQSAARLS